MFSHQLYIIYRCFFKPFLYYLQRTDGTSRCTSHLFFGQKNPCVTPCRKPWVSLTCCSTRPRSFKILASLGTSDLDEKSSGSSLGLGDDVEQIHYFHREKTHQSNSRGLYIHYQDSLWIAGGFQWCLIFTPKTWGNDPIWRAYVSIGVVQPPTRYTLKSNECPPQEQWPFQKEKHASNHHFWRNMLVFVVYQIDRLVNAENPYHHSVTCCFFMF